MIAQKYLPRNWDFWNLLQVYTKFISCFTNVEFYKLHQPPKVQSS